MSTSYFELQSSLSIIFDQTLDLAQVDVKLMHLIYYANVKFRFLLYDLSCWLISRLLNCPAYLSHTQKYLGNVQKGIHCTQHSVHQVVLQD